MVNYLKCRNKMKIKKKKCHNKNKKSKRKRLKDIWNKWKRIQNKIKSYMRNYNKE